MSLSGPDALRSLDEALRDVRREEDDIAKRVARSAELVAKLRETESELLRELAKLRLDPAMQAELGDRLGQAEVKARDMLARHGDDLAAAEAGLRTLDAKIAALAAERAEKTVTIERGRQTLKALADKVAAGVEQEPAYAEAQRAAKALAAVAAESLDKTGQAETDRDTKGRPYRDDPLFMYLWERGYGTRNYRENNLVAYLDSLVARMVGFVERAQGIGTGEAHVSTSRRTPVPVTIWSPPRRVRAWPSRHRGTRTP